MPTTRSQSKAMSTPPISSVLEEPESPKSTSSQETPWSTQSINNTSPLGNQLSPGWVHSITIIMGKIIAIRSWRNAPKMDTLSPNP